MHPSLAAHLPRFSSHSVPPGVWRQDAHQDGPVLAFVEPMLASFGRGFRAGFSHWGFPLAGVGHVLIDGWLYLAEEDLTDVEELARRLARVEAIGDLVEIREAASRFADTLLPDIDARRRAIAPGALDTRSAEELVDALVAAYSLLVEFGEQRMTFLPGTNLLTSAFLVDGAAAGLTRLDCLRHLAGSSRSTTALAGDLARGDATGVGSDELADEYADDLLATDGAQPPLALRADGWWATANAPDPVPAGAAPPGELPDGLAGTLADARLAQDVREASRELFMRLLGRARRIAAELGTRLAARGVLDTADDVAFLTPAEIVAAAGAGASGAATRALVRSRRHDVAAVATPPDPVIGVPVPTASPLAEMAANFGPGALRIFVLAMSWTPAIDGNAPAQASAAEDADTGDSRAVEIRGVAASPGSVTAPVRVVHDVDELLDVQPGEILVCGCTTPAWSVAVSVSAGLIATGGGDCSHPAIVAREFGIPAVVGAAAATSLRTGDVVTLDGAAGTVTVHAA